MRLLPSFKILYYKKDNMLYSHNSTGSKNLYNQFQILRTMPLYSLFNEIYMICGHACLCEQLESIASKIMLQASGKVLCFTFNQ
jgi:hypothetical protein